MRTNAALVHTDPIHNVLLIAALIALAIIPACDTAGPATFEEEIVVESYQVAGEPLRPVRLTRTLPTDVIYERELTAVSGAVVAVERLTSSGGVAASYDFVEDDSTGIYFPSERAVVEPLTRYRLRVTVPDGSDPSDLITATTLVPDTFHVSRAPADTLIYGLAPLMLEVTPSRYPDRQSVYIFTTTALGPLARERLATPFFDEEDALEDVRRLSSPILNEANYERLPEGNISIEVPWIAIPFFGDNVVEISALDENLYDFQRSYAAQAQGSTLRPGEIPNILENVDGGIGVFGSYARAGHQFYVERP